MNKTSRHIFILFLLLAVSIQGFAQLRPVIRRPPGAERRILRETAIERVERVKEHYITQRLDLTSDESAKFWPVYRRYQAEITEIRTKRRINNSAAEPDGAEQIKNELNFESDLVNVRKKYTSEFLKFLPAEKVSALFKAEREFNDELIRQLRERNQSGSTSSNNPPS